MKEETFKINGMHCASCANIITKKISKLNGIKNIEVNYATEKAKITFADKELAPLSTLNETLSELGYSFTGTENNVSSEENLSETKQIKELKKKELEEMREKKNFIFPIALFIFGIMMWDIGNRFFDFIPKVPIPMHFLNIISMVLATITLFWVGQPFLKGIVKFIKYRDANMNTLIGIGTFTAYLYSTIITLIPSVRDYFNLPEYTYFDVTIVVIGFVILGKYLETKSKHHTGEAIEKLIGLQAKTALIKKDGKEIEIPTENVQIGDIIIVKPGAKIPVDGEIVFGNSSIDESMINGEPIPVDKKIGDTVIGSTINKQGYFEFKATKVGKETMLAQIIMMVEEAQGSKAPIQALVDKISSIFVPTVLILAIVTLFLWIFVGQIYLPFSTALSYGLLSFTGILVIACPCALGLATPTAIIAGVGKGAENGILIKNAESLEKLNKVKIIVFDKTGTITKGFPEVTNIISLNNQIKEKDILTIAGSVEKMSEHPLAKAITEKAINEKITLKTPTDFSIIEGVGVQAILEEEKIYIHKPNKEDLNILALTELQKEGKTVVIIEKNSQKIGMIALSDTIKDNAKETIKKIKKEGIKTVMLTGDNTLTANYIGKEIGVDEIISEVLPNEKALKIKELQKNGNMVAMVGDGINDAPALAQSDIGIAMANGTDVAIESASITLLNDDLNKILISIKLAKYTIRTIRQNLFWAFIYNIVGIPIAGGLLYPIWGIILNPIFAGMAMAGSSVSVVANSLKLKIKKIK